MPITNKEAELERTRPVSFQLAFSQLEIFANRLWRNSQPEEIDFVYGRIWLHALELAHRLNQTTVADILAGIDFSTRDSKEHKELPCTNLNRNHCKKNSTSSSARCGSNNDANEQRESPHSTTLQPSGGDRTGSTLTIENPGQPRTNTTTYNVFKIDGGWEANERICQASRNPTGDTESSRADLYPPFTAGRQGCGYELLAYNDISKSPPTHFDLHCIGSLINAITHDVPVSLPPHQSSTDIQTNSTAKEMKVDSVGSSATEAQHQQVNGEARPALAVIGTLCEQAISGYRLFQYNLTRDPSIPIVEEDAQFLTNIRFSEPGSLGPGDVMSLIRVPVDLSFTDESLKKLIYAIQSDHVRLLWLLPTSDSVIPSLFYNQPLVDILRSSPGPIRRPFAVTWRMRHKYAYAPRKTPISSKEPISTSWLNEETSQFSKKDQLILESQNEARYSGNGIRLGTEQGRIVADEISKGVGILQDLVSCVSSTTTRRKGNARSENNGYRKERRSKLYEPREQWNENYRNCETVKESGKVSPSDHNRSSCRKSVSDPDLFKSNNGRGLTTIANRSLTSDTPVQTLLQIDPPVNETGNNVQCQIAGLGQTMPNIPRNSKNDCRTDLIGTERARWNQPSVRSDGLKPRLFYSANGNCSLLYSTKSVVYRLSEIGSMARGNLCGSRSLAFAPPTVEMPVNNFLTPPIAQHSVDKQLKSKMSTSSNPCSRLATFVTAFPLSAVTRPPTVQLMRPLLTSRDVNLMTSCVMPSIPPPPLPSPVVTTSYTPYNGFVTLNTGSSVGGRISMPSLNQKQIRDYTEAHNGHSGEMNLGHQQVPLINGAYLTLAPFSPPPSFKMMQDFPPPPIQFLPCSVLSHRFETADTIPKLGNFVSNNICISSEVSTPQTMFPHTSEYATRSVGASVIPEMVIHPNHAMISQSANTLLPMWSASPNQGMLINQQFGHNNVDGPSASPSGYGNVRSLQHLTTTLAEASKPAMMQHASVAATPAAAAAAAAAAAVAAAASVPADFKHFLPPPPVPMNLNADAMPFRSNHLLENFHTQSESSNTRLPMARFKLSSPMF